MKPYLGNIPTVLKSFGNRTETCPPRVSPEADAADIEELHNATGVDRIELRNRIAGRYLRMIIHLVYKKGYTDGYGVFSEEDFAQEACLGLIQAIESHNNTCPLSNYIARHASWRMVKALDFCAPGFRRKQETFGSQYIDFASFDDTAKADDNETFSLSEVLPADDAEVDFDSQKLHYRIAEILSQLDEFHRVIVAELAGFHDGEPKSLSRLGKRFGLNPATIWMHQQKALAQLRRAFPEMREYLPGWDPEKHRVPGEAMCESPRKNRTKSPDGTIFAAIAKEARCSVTTLRRCLTDPAALVLRREEIERIAQNHGIKLLPAVPPKPVHVSLRQIARELGCSLPTVLRCLKEPSAYIQRRAEIEKLLEKHGYRTTAAEPAPFSIGHSVKIKISQRTPSALALAAAFAA